MSEDDNNSDFWIICPICGEDAVIGQNDWLCTECGAYYVDESSHSVPLQAPDSPVEA